MTPLQKSTLYYTVVIENYPTDILGKIQFFERHIMEYAVPAPNTLPSYINQGDALIADGAYIYGDNILNIPSAQLLTDFSYCFAFILFPNENEEDPYRYTQHYKSELNIEEVKQIIPIEETLLTENESWKAILSASPDYFYIRDEKQIVFGGRDYFQIKEFIDKIS